MNTLIATLIVLLPSLTWAADPAPKAGAAPKSTPELVAKGKAAYATNCATCHGDKGDGMGPAGKYMSPKPRNFITDKFKKGNSTAELFTTVTKGLEGTAMAGYASIPEADRWAIVYYVQSFKK